MDIYHTICAFANELWKQPLEDILDQMGLYAGPSEDRMLRNVAAMMFCEDPSKFFPYTQIDVVTFPNGKIANPNNFTEKTFKGSVPQMINSTMEYLKGNVLKEYVHKVPGKQEADRYWNYPYEALEESVTNSLYHRDYQQHEPVEIAVEPDCITILNCPGPDRSISREAIEKGDYLKNRRLGDFLKELDLTEGRSTGVPTIQSKLAANGSSRATFETTDDRLTFLITIPVHEGCVVVKSSEKSQKSSEKIIDIILSNPKVTRVELAMNLGISSRGVEKQIRNMREAGVLRRVGGDKGGYWEIVSK